jgi:hypothetical protein
MITIETRAGDSRDPPAASRTSTRGALECQPARPSVTRHRPLPHKVDIAVIKDGFDLKVRMFGKEPGKSWNDVKSGKGHCCGKSQAAR